MTAASIEIYMLSSMQSVISTIPVQYNPSELSVSYANKIIESAGISDSAQQKVVADGVTTEMNFKLVLDGFHENEAKAQDVSEYVLMLTPALQLDEKKINAYGCRFQWGDCLYQGMLTGLKVRYTMFTSEGKPIRANVDITLKGGLTDKEKQLAKSTSSRLSVKTKLMELYLEAFEKNGSSSEWRELAKKKKVKNPRKQG